MDPTRHDIKPWGKIGPSTSFRVRSCQEEMDKQIDRKNQHAWLQLQRALQNVPGKAIATMVGHVHKHGDVIVKVQMASLAKREWDTAQHLKDVRGFIQFLCYFTCAGDAKYIEDFSPLTTHKHVCIKKGSQMGIVMMPFYPSGSLEDWLVKLQQNNAQSVAFLKLILCKTTFYVFQAFSQKGFTHGDLFAKNILLQDTEPIVIDYEKSSLSPDNHQRFWRDLDDLFGDVGRFVMGRELDEISRRHIYMNLAYDRPPTARHIRDICLALQAL
jgi:serine/threonine protein kinase